MGSLGKVEDSSDSEMVCQCLSKLLFRFLVWLENVVLKMIGLSFWVGLGLEGVVVWSYGTLDRVSEIR